MNVSNRLSARLCTVLFAPMLSRIRSCVLRMSICSVELVLPHIWCTPRHVHATCMQPLTVQTLRQASRGIRNLLAELKIRCEFVDRGCRKIVDLGDLERHVADCGFAPAVCSNEGCQLEVNKQDLLHHETTVCELRRVQCHSCNEIRRRSKRLCYCSCVLNMLLIYWHFIFTCEKTDLFVYIHIFYPGHPHHWRVFQCGPPSITIN